MKLSQRRMGKPSLGGILATRQGAMVLAIVCAAGAAGVMLFAFSSYKTGVVQQKAVVPIQATVLVATGEIRKGTTGKEVAAGKLYKSTPILATQVAAGAISNAAALQGATAQSDILPGQQLTSVDFNLAAGVTSQLTPDQRAISVPSDEIHGDLDVLSPGDHVDLYASLSVKTPQGTNTEVAFIGANVLVLKTPSSSVLGAPASAVKPTTSTTAASTTSALVLALSSSTVPLLELSSDTGKIWLTLRPPSATPPPGGITSLQTILSEAGVAPNVAPYGSPATTAPNPNNAANNSATNTNTTGKH